MATFSISTHLASLTFLIFHLKVLTANPNFSFSFESFRKSVDFESNIALFGDAKAVDNGSSIQLTRLVSSSSGRLMYKKPIKLVEGNPGILASFATHFSFLMSPNNGDGVAFVMVPSDFNSSVLDNSPFWLSSASEKSSPKIVVIEFKTLKDAEYGDLNENHVGIDVGGFVSVKARNVSSIDTALNGGKRLQSWIAYEHVTKRLEVRLSLLGSTKPIDPLLSYPIDLSQMWSDGKVFVGLSSSNRNSYQTCFVYSWNFKLRFAPHWMHSQPLDPQAFRKIAKPVAVQTWSDCLLRVLSAMIFGAACGALGAFILLYMWTIFGNTGSVVPEECSVDPMDFEYKKVSVVVDKTMEDGKQ